MRAELVGEAASIAINPVPYTGTNRASATGTAFEADWRGRYAHRGPEVISLDANGNPLHPTDPLQAEGLHNTIRIAGEMGIKSVCTTSDLPAGNATEKMQILSK